MQPLHRVISLLLVALSAAVPAAAQTTGTLGVGIGISAVRPRAPELSTTPRLRPTIRRIPSRGWGFAGALNWFDADVDGSRVGNAGRLGRLSIRPLMVGIGYTAVHGRIGISPSLVAGPALNTLSIDAEVRDRVSVGGNRFEKTVGSVSIAVRPGVNVTYAVAPRVAVTGFGGYLFNRPAIVLQEAAAETRIRWNADGVVLSAGVLVTF